MSVCLFVCLFVCLSVCPRRHLQRLRKCPQHTEKIRGNVWLEGGQKNGDPYTSTEVTKSITYFNSTQIGSTPPVRLRNSSPHA